jgi:regulator of replication initiation timing
MKTRIAGLLMLVFLMVSGVSAAELSVSKVVLYKHGIGFFERTGEIPTGDNAQLRFKADEMNDVLKSLTVEQVGGQGVSAIRYDSSDPLSKRLEVFPFQIGERATLASILDQFKGAEVELRLAAGNVQGSIVSARTVAGTQNQPEHEELLLLIASGELRTVDPAAASGLRFVDPRLQTQFQDYLQIVSRSRDLEKRTVTIESQGAAGRVTASYVVPTPIWKSSYRLVFGAGDQPLLEGWAIVDNTTGEDWGNVNLSLVSGLPVSFISKLYEPRYLERPVIQLAQDRAWRPTVHGGAIEEAEVKAAAMPPPPPPPPPAAAVGGVIGGIASNRAYRQTLADGGERLGEPDAAPFAREAMSSTVAATAVRAELGELFEYRIDHPVTVRAGESAMLPFFRSQVKARRLLIYDESNGSQHPLNAVEVTNSAGTTLDGGAITVYEAGAYAGEALVETIKSGDKRLISYAVDLGTRITTAFDSQSKLLSEFHLRRGILTLRNSRLNTKTFTIHNVDNKPKTVIIEHPVRPEFNLVDAKPVEKTANAYRFEVQIAANETKKFPLTEEHIFNMDLAVTNLTHDQLLSYVRNRELNEQGRQRLEQLANLKRQIADTDREIQRHQEQVQSLFEDQNRLRNNISTLRSVAGQDGMVQEYANKLSQQERELVSLRDRQSQLKQQRDDLQRQENELIETMEF